MTLLPVVCVCEDAFCGGSGDVYPGEPGYCVECAALDPEDHCLVCVCCMDDEP